MSKDNSYINDVFTDNTILPTSSDVSQKLKYRYVRAYPSVNSTNGGQIHSEENIRWLSKQFVNKPFILPSNKDGFKYSYDPSDLGSCTGGLVNIDGYIINTSNKLENMSFDNTTPTPIGTDSVGYINVNKLFEDIKQFMLPLLENQDISKYIKLNINDITFLEPIRNMSVSDKENFCNTHGINYPNDWSVVNYIKLSAIMDGISTKVDEITIPYNKDISNYISSNFDMDKVHQTEDSTEENRKLVYDILYGIPNDKLQPSNKENPTPILYFIDIFGFTYIWDSNVSVHTSTYPSSFNNHINILEDSITPDEAKQEHFGDSGINTQIFNFNGGNHIYDTTSLYNINAIDKDNPEISKNLDFLKKSGIYNKQSGTLKESEVEKLSTYKLRSDSANISWRKDLNTFLDLESNADNYVFLIKRSSDILDMYLQYKPGGNVEEFLNSQDICDCYYCLPVNKLGNMDNINKFNELFGLKTYKVGQVQQYAPIGFMTSSGHILSDSVIYKNGNDENVLIEGYVPFIRRVCKILMGGYDLTHYGNLDNYNESSKAWTKLIKDLEIKGAKLDTEISTYYNDYICTLFDVDEEGISSVKFSNVYNKLIAPYMNFYMQLAWSGLYINTINDNRGLKAYNGASAIKNAPSQPPIPYITDDEGNVYVDVTRKYQHNSIDITVQKSIKYTNNTYIDYQRLQKFLKTAQPLDLWNGSKIQYREEQTGENPINSINKLGLCEDFITYLKHCNISGYDNTYDDSDKINIPYKVTSLEVSKDSADNTLYGFNILEQQVDRYARYVTIPTQTEKGKALYKKANSGTLSYDDITGRVLTPKVGYIQNVTINLNTLLPVQTFVQDSDFYYPLIISTDEESWEKGTELNDSTISTKTYTLQMNNRNTVSQNGQTNYGTDGFNFAGKSQGWVMGVPTVLRLYQNSLNHLEGKTRGYDTHAGVVIDFKLPYTIEDSDFWFANIWFSPVCTMSTWEIENNCATIPTNTDGMLEYLHRRNSMIVPFEELYGKNGDLYVSLEEYIQNFLDNVQLDFNTQISTLQNQTNQEVGYLKSLIDIATSRVLEQFENSPALNYSDAIIDPETDKFKYELTQYKGVVNNVKRLKKQVDDSLWLIEQYSGKQTEIYIRNNTYQDISNNIFTKKETLIIKPITGELYRQYVSVQDADNFGLTVTPSNSYMFNTSVRLKFKDKMFLKLPNIDLNKATVGEEEDYINITWTSNYPVKKTHGRLSQTDSRECDIYTITLDDWYKKKSCEVILDISITYDRLTESAKGYVNIKQVANNRLLSDMDMSYLWHDLYKIDRLPWERISELTETGLAEKLWELGDMKTLQLVDDDGNIYKVSAMIIGFNQDGENTITWLSNIYNNNIPAGTPEEQEAYIKRFKNLFVKKFNTYHEVTSYKSGELIIKQATCTDGYNACEDPTSDVTKAFEGTADWKWLNAEDNKGIQHYMEQELLNIIQPVTKVSRMLYLVRNNEGGYVEYDNCAYYKHFEPALETSKLWLPTLGELNMKYEDFDSAEKSAIENARLSTPDIKTLRRNPKGKVTQVDDIDSTDRAYEYFTLPHDEQNVKSLTLMCRSFYAVRSDEIDAVENPFTDTTHQFNERNVWNDYRACPRTTYCVGTGYDSNTTSGRWLNILDKNDIIEVLRDEIVTDFCFVTK